MKGAIEKIRQLLDDLESNLTSEEPSFKETLQLFEVPELVASILTTSNQFPKAATILMGTL
jgi:hypothetical protein